jgi:hypothetical protein
LTRSMAGVEVAVTIALSLSVTAAPSGGRPVTVAVLAITPASMFGWVTLYVAVQVVEMPGASDVTGQVTADRPGSGSLTTTPMSVTLPVLVTRNE